MRIAEPELRSVANVSHITRRLFWITQNKSYRPPKLAKLLPLGTPVEILRTRTDQKSEAERLGSLWMDQTINPPANLAALPVVTATDATLPGAVPVAATVAPTSSTVPAQTSAAPTTTASTSG